MITSKNRPGIALAWTAIILFIMVGIVGLSIDWGWTTQDAHNLQNAADAGALSGALVVKTAYHEGVVDDPTDPKNPYGRARALTMANSAGGAPVDVCYDAATNDSTLDVVIGQWAMSTRTFLPLVSGASDIPNAVKVVARHSTGWAVNQPLSLNFGPVFGAQTTNVQREAVAICAGGGGAALVCLSPYGVGLEIDGGGKVYVNAGPVPGEVWVDSFATGPDSVYPNANGAPDASKGWYIDCGGLYSCGTIDQDIIDYFATPPDHFVYPVWPELPAPIPDPLWSVPALNVGAMNPRNETPASPYGMIVQADQTTGMPPVDAVTGQYILTPQLGRGGNDKNKVFNVAAGNPVTGDTVNNYYGYQDPTTGRQTVFMTPGYYPGGIKLTGTSASNRTIRMLPGVYAFGGGAKNGDNSGLVLNGGRLDAEGVMIYVTNSKLDATGYWGQVNISGSYEYVNITEYQYLAGDPAYYQMYDYKNYGNAGFAIFQDRRNPQDAVIIGGADKMTMAGTLYFHCTGQTTGTPYPPSPLPAGTWDVTVEVGGSTGQTGIQMIMDRLLVHGDANVIVKYDGRNMEPANMVFLVK